MQPLLERTETSWRIDRSVPVIPSHLVITGRIQMNTSLVGDDEWLLECAIAKPGKSYQNRIRFASIDDIDERELIREVLFLSLNHELRDNARGGLSVLKPGSLIVASNNTRSFLRDVRDAGLQLHDID